MPHAPRLTSRRGRVHALFTASLAATIAFSGLSLSIGQGSAHATENEATTGPQATLVVAPESPVLKSDASQFRFEVLLKNPSKQPLGAGTVTLSIDNVKAETTADLSADADRDSLEIGTVEAVTTEGGKQQLIELVVSRDDFPLLFTREAGAYPVHAEFTAADSVANDAAVEEVEAPTLNASTAVVWNDAATTSPLSLTLIVPLVLPSSIEALPTRDELVSVTPRLLQLLNAAEQRYATIAVDPRIIAGIRALGENAPGTAATLLERLEQSPNPIFLLQFADADPAVQAALGFEQLLQPLGFGHATVHGKFETQAATSDAHTGSAETALSDEGTSSGTTADADSAPQVDPVTGAPTLENMLSLDNARPGAWPAGGEVDSATLVLLQNAGLTSLVLDSHNVSGATTPRVHIGEFEALVSDAPTGLAARTSLSGATATERSAGTAELASRLALAAQHNTGGVVLALDRGVFADIADPLQIFDTIDEMTWVQTVSERQQPSSNAELRAGAPTEERRELLRATVARSSQIDELAPLLVEPEYLIEFQRERLLATLASRYAAPGVDFSAIDKQNKDRDGELLKGVSPLINESTQLVGALSNVPITLSNSLPFEALVTLHSAPTSAAISVPERNFEVRVPAVGSASVLVPVHSRVSSGSAGLLLEVRDTRDDRSFSSVMHPLTLRTSVETTLIWLVGSAAALLLGFGIWRSVRRRRKGIITEASADTDPGAAGASPGETNEPSASEE